MKRFRIFEDSAPFSLVIKQSVQENTSSEQQPFHWGPRFHIGCRGLGRIQTLRPKKQSVRGKPLKSRWPYGSGTGIKGLWYRERNTTNTALRKTIRPKPASNEMLAPWENPVKTSGGNGTKRPKTRPSETTPCTDRLSTIITVRE